MSVPATLLRLGGAAELQVFIYRNAEARTNDTHRLNPNHVEPPNMRIAWTMPPTLITSSNLAVILLTHDNVIRDRVQHALATAPRHHD